MKDCLIRHMFAYLSIRKPWPPSLLREGVIWCVGRMPGGVSGSEPNRERTVEKKWRPSRIFDMRQRRARIIASVFFEAVLLLIRILDAISLEVYVGNITVTRVATVFNLLELLSKLVILLPPT